MTQPAWPKTSLRSAALLLASSTLLACAHHASDYNPAAAFAEDKARAFEPDAAATTAEDRKGQSPVPAGTGGAPSALVGGTEPASATAAQVAAGRTLDDFHAAAAAADEARYFAHFARDAVFLGTDATERWSVAAFRSFAHPFFARGKAWSFTSVRRHVTVLDGGTAAFFDEELATPNLGPARGSGVLVREGSAWKIAQYNLAITVPNEKMSAIRALLERPADVPAK
ncbi:MAG: hypothetical protein NVSMB23_00560 [Myxococcales bacterium]